jgi:probable selenium-dependent hydroxylase accessory protein YqeC
MSELLDVVEARTGIVCAVGAGGKKTTLYHLATQHPGRVGITCTVPMAAFPSTLGAHEVIADDGEIVQAVVHSASQYRLTAFAHPEVKRARYGGLAAEFIAKIHKTAGFEVLFVKGDGARMRWIKAPEEDEPLIPDGTTTVLPIVSARAIGEPLTDEVAHRLSRVEVVTGASRGEPLLPAHVARLLASDDGALKSTGSAVVVPIINMVDDAGLAAAAERAARLALELTDRFDRVVLTSAQRPDPLVQVIHRT